MSFINYLALADELDVEGYLKVAVSKESAWINEEQALEVMTKLNKVFNLGLDDFLEEEGAPEREYKENNYWEKEGDLTPKFYTSREGGSWERYIGEPRSREDLRLYMDHAPLKTMCMVVDNSGIAQPVHSLAFDNPALGDGNFPRWDIVNGWTTPIGDSK